MKSITKKILGLILIIILTTMISGCTSFNKKLSRNFYKKKENKSSFTATYITHESINLNKSNFYNIEYEGKITVGETIVEYQKGLEQQAQFIAETTDNMCKYVQSETGINFATNPHIYLIRVQQYPQNININIDIFAPTISVSYTDKDTTSQNLVYNTTSESLSGDIEILIVVDDDTDFGSYGLDWENIKDFLMRLLP